MLCGEWHPSTVADYDDARRKARLAETGVGYGWGAWRRTRLVLLRLALIPAVVLGVFAQYWAIDVAPERARLARTEPAVMPIAGPADPQGRNTAVFDLVGLGALDATDTARALPSLARLGSVWAVRYDNTGIDTKVISDLIVKVTDAARVDNIVLVGHSMGGVIALEIAKHLYTGSGKKLGAVMLDCTPVNLNAVRPESRDQGEELLRWTGWLPGSRESRTLRLIAETFARRDHFVDYGSVPPGIRVARLRESVAEVLRQKIFNTDAASNGLIEAQFKAIVASGAVDDLRALAKPAADKPRPAIVFIRPHDADRDPIVDDEYTHRVLIDRVGGVNGTLLVVLTRGTGHANPMQQPGEYNKVIEQQVVPFVRLVRREELAAMQQPVAGPRAPGQR
ncbi:alpha/beta hydrolase [Nocardia terpenica]|nr:alpha/beta hydrolase [Nocardia terpenica]MBF6064394.1 alpha/beta hydrolase [Nocardia terpenica]MBF6106982.1 alpha/beta hydrolase [Nocardia terpenica]MBF6114362.1 alpha/beta hydrolase [Nocardia terpenica]MBF6121552.1 alpha/beta hydrolase [Nocardia terpenica]MBF6153967.1 alpha/beta hydrolase [Nocardia terpenica]